MRRKVINFFICSVSENNERDTAPMAALRSLWLCVDRRRIPRICMAKLLKICETQQITNYFFLPKARFHATPYSSTRSKNTKPAPVPRPSSLPRILRSGRRTPSAWGAEPAASGRKMSEARHSGECLALSFCGLCSLWGRGGYQSASFALMNSRLRRAMLAIVSFLGQTASQARVLVQLPKPSSSILATMALARLAASGRP